MMTKQAMGWTLAAALLMAAPGTTPAQEEAGDNATTAGAAATGRGRGALIGAPIGTMSGAAVGTAAEAGLNEFTTQAFDMMWKRIEPDYKEAGIPQEKIDELKKMEFETRSSMARGERPDLKANRQRRNEILTREDQQKLHEIRRARRDREFGAPGGVTTGTQSGDSGSTAALTKQY